MKAQHKRLTHEDKFARKYYCNSYRFVYKIKKYNSKKLRRIMRKDCLHRVGEWHLMA